MVERVWAGLDAVGFLGADPGTCAAADPRLMGGRGSVRLMGLSLIHI